MTAPAFALRVVFSHISKSPDGSQLFTAQCDPVLVGLAALVACGVGLVAAVIPARRAHEPGAGEQGVRGGYSWCRRRGKVSGGKCKKKRGESMLSVSGGKLPGLLLFFREQFLSASSSCLPVFGADLAE